MRLGKNQKAVEIETISTASLGVDIALGVGGLPRGRVVEVYGPDNPAQSAPGTIRGDLAIAMTENVIHGSDSAESARREIALFFPDLA